MPAIYHEGSWLGNATDPEVLVKDTVGWTGKNRAYSQTNNAVIAHIENGITYDVSWTGSATVTLKKNSASGATITSGSTSPLSFTADVDYELYFGSSATVTNIMVKDSRITDPTYEPYHESVEEEIEQIYADNGVLGAKNLLKYPYDITTQTLNGMTLTTDDNGVVTLNGTTTAVTEFYLLGTVNTMLKVSELPSNLKLKGSGSTDYCCEAVYRTSDNIYISDQRAWDNMELVIPSNAYYVRMGVLIKSNVTLSNAKLYPMLRLASDPDDTYQPYAMTNRELTEMETVIPVDVSEFTVSSTDITINTNWSCKVGKVLNVSLMFTCATAVPAFTNIITMPNYYLGNGKSGITAMIALAYVNTPSKKQIMFDVPAGTNAIKFRNWEAIEGNTQICITATIIIK